MAEDYIDYTRDERLKVSLAEMSLAEQLLTLARVVEDVVRDTALVVRELASGNPQEALKMYDRIREAMRRAEEIKDATLLYIARLGVELQTANYFKDLSLKLARIAQLMDGAAYRAKVLAESQGGELPSTTAKLMGRIASVLQEMYGVLLNATRMVQDNPRLSYEDAGKVISYEEEVDKLYREAVLNIYRALATAKQDELMSILLARDIIDFLEDAADVAREAAEDIRFLSLYRTARL